MNYRQQSEQDAIERWNVGYARDWDASIVDTDQVYDALYQQMMGANWNVADAQLVADAEYIANWLHDERNK